MEIFLQARAILAGFMGLPPAKKAILRGMLAHPELFDHVMAWGAKFQKIFTREVNDVIGTSCARINSPLIGDRHFRGLAEKPFHRLLPELDTAPAKGRPRAAFFVGCLLDKFFPDIARAAVDVLQAHGVGIFMPPGQACCGIPAVSSGDTQTFGRLVRHNLALFEAGRFDYLVTACATCTATIRKVWPMMLREETTALRARVEKMAVKTLDVNQFLVDEVGVLTRDRQKDGEPVAVTYHDPCHLKKSLGVAAQPRAVIAANPDYRLIEMPEADACCGMGGSFNLQYYELSAGIGRRKRDNIQASGAAIVATGCPACMLQISDALSRTGDRVAVRHPVQLYAESLRSKP
jgi:glycolate oxidase iron-sulfur subunit